MSSFILKKRSPVKDGQLVEIPDDAEAMAIYNSGMETSVAWLEPYDRNDIWFAIHIQDDHDVWVTSDSYGPSFSKDLVSNTLLFRSEDLAHEFMSKFSGEYEVVQVKPRYRKMVIGYDAVQCCR